MVDCFFFLIYLKKNKCVANGIFDVNSYLLLNKYVFKSPRAVNKVDIRREFYKCDSYHKLSWETSLKPITIPNPFTCVDSGGTTCTFSQQTNIFDNDLSGTTCSQNTWTYQANKVPTVSTDFYSSADVLSRCTKLTQDQATTSIPTQSASN